VFVHHGALFLSQHPADFVAPATVLANRPDLFDLFLAQPEGLLHVLHALALSGAPHALSRSLAGVLGVDAGCGECQYE
jgi:hypothetical protein